MHLIAALDLAMEIEDLLSRCYSRLSEKSAESDLREEFVRLAEDERNHLNLIKIGKNYVFEAPEAFGEDVGFYAELKEGLGQVKDLLNDLDDPNAALEEGLERMYTLEMRLECVHFDSLAEIKDPQLNSLFKALGEGDKAHRERLKALKMGMGKGR